MENNVFIQNGKPEHFDFQLAISGLSGQDVHVRFMLHSEPFHMVFQCIRANDDTWSLDLPAMPFLEASTYNFVIEAIIDGYYFPAHEGTLTVSKSPEVYIQKTDAEMKVRVPASTVRSPKSIATIEPNPEAEKEQIVSPAPRPQDKGDNFKEIIDRLKPSVKDPDAEKKETEVVVDAEKKEDKKVDDKATEVVVDAEKKEDKKVDDKKDDDKEDDVKEDNIADPLAKAHQIANRILVEEEEPATPAPDTNKAKRARDVLKEHKQEQAKKKAKKRTPAPKAKKIVVEDVKDDKKEQDAQKARDIIAEHKQEQVEKKEKEKQRKERLAESRRKRAAKKKEAKKDTPVVESKEESEKESEKDRQARAVLESVKTPEQTPQPKSAIFKKGDTVVK